MHSFRLFIFFLFVFFLFYKNNGIQVSFFCTRPPPSIYFFFFFFIIIIISCVILTHIHHINIQNNIESTSWNNKHTIIKIMLMMMMILYPCIALEMVPYEFHFYIYVGLLFQNVHNKKITKKKSNGERFFYYTIF